MLSTATPREGRTGHVAIFGALFLGAAIVTMTSLLLGSARPQTPPRFSSAEILVHSAVAAPGGDDFAEARPWTQAHAQQLVDRLGRIDGVARAVADLSFYAQAVIDGRPVGDPAAGDMQGHGWASAALAPHRLVSGAAPARDGEVVVDRALDLAPGSRVTLLTAGGPVPYTVTGTLDAPGFWVTDQAAGRLSGGVRVIGLRTVPGTDPVAVRRAAEVLVGGQGRVLTGDERAGAEPRFEARIRWIGWQVLSAMASLAGFASIFVAASVFAFRVVQRRRAIGLLRTVGATPGQVRRMLLAEALGIGGLATAAGVVLGTILARILAGVLIDLGFEPASFAVRIEPVPLIRAFVYGVVAALAAVLLASRRAARIRPIEALREAAVDSRPMSWGRWILGGSFTALGLVMAVGAFGVEADDLVDFALQTTMALIVGVSLLAPAITGPAVRLVSWPLRGLQGATTGLVREGMLAGTRRTASTVAAVLVTVGFGVLITGLVQTRAAAHTLRRSTSIQAGTIVAPAGVPGLSDAVATRVGGQSMLPTTVYATLRDQPGGVRAYSGTGVPPQALARPLRRLDVVAGSLNELRGPGTAAVTARAARDQGWGVGSTIRVTLADGQVVALRLVAVLAGGTAPADLVLPRDVVRTHDPSALTEVIYADSTVDQVPGQLGAEALDVKTFATNADAEEDRLEWIFILLLISVSVGYSAIAMTSTLTLVTADRIGDFSVLRLSGATPRQVLRVTAAETTLAVGIGTALGTAVALPALLGIRSSLSAKVGAPVALTIPWSAVLGMVGACLLIALTATLLPTRTALRSYRRPVMRSSSGA